MKFKYLAKTKQGGYQTGIIEAADQMAAVKILQGYDLIILKLESSEGLSVLVSEIKFLQRVKKKELFVFFRQLATLVDAGVPIVQSFRSLADQVDNKYFKEIIIDVSNEVEGGMPFSIALARHANVFSSFSIYLIQTGEVSGRLQDCLNYLADYLEREYYIISKIKGSMIYPGFILCTFLLIGVVVMTMVVPQLTQVLKEIGQELPLPTRILIFASEALRKWWWLELLIIFGALISFSSYIKTEKGRLRWDAFKLKLPVFGKLFKQTYLSRLADNLSVLVKGGVSILQAMGVAAKVIGNRVFENIILEARDEVRVGKSISSVFEKHGEITSLFVQMVKTGEQSGKLDMILEKLSIFYGKEVDNMASSLSQLIEPVLIIGLGLAVGIMVAAVFLPIYNMVGAM